MGDPGRFSIFGLPIVEDRLGGPLARIHAGLEWARAHRPKCRFAISATADTPFLPANLASLLRSVIDGDKPKLVVARSENGLHPVFGFGRLAANLGASLESGSSTHEAGGRKIDPFFNINRPGELVVAEAFLQSSAA
jgi:molybdopterin-guanine dinucleotide biosynthesis protein A